MLFVALSSSVGVRGAEAGAVAFFASSPRHVPYVVTSTQGRPILGAHYGILNVVGATPNSDSIIQLPTIGTVYAVEPTRTGYVVLTGGRQVLRDDGSGQWRLARSFNSDADILMSRTYYAVGTPDSISVFHNDDDRPLFGDVIRDRRITCCATLPSGRIGLGFNDGALWVVDPQTGANEQYHVAFDSIAAITDDAHGALIATTSDGTWRYDPSSRQWLKFVPGIITQYATRGTNIRILIRREYRNGDRLYTAVSVVDTVGWNPYNALLERAIGDSLGAWSLVVLQDGFPVGPRVWSGDPTSMIAVTSTPGQYRRLHVSDSMDTETTLPSFSAHVIRDGGAMVRGLQDELIWTTSLRAVPPTSLPPINLQYRLDTLGQLTADTVPLPSALWKGAVSAVIESTRHTAYHFSNVDTMAVVDLVTDSLTIAPRVRTQYMHRDGPHIAGWSGGTVSFSSDHGVTWRRNVRTFEWPIIDMAHLPDGRWVCTRAIPGRLGETTLAVTSDMGETWVEHPIYRSWGTIAGYRNGLLVLLPYDVGTDDVPLQIALLTINPDNGTSTVELDTILPYRGRVTSGAFLGDRLYLLVQGEAGLLRVAQDLWSVEQVDTTFRIPDRLFYLTRDVRSDRVIFHATDGWMVELSERVVSSVPSVPDDAHMADVWPTPASSAIHGRVYVSDAAVQSMILGGLYDLAGQLVADVTPELRKAPYNDGWIEFRLYSQDLPSGVYRLAIQSGRSALSRPVLIVR